MQGSPPQSSNWFHLRYLKELTLYLVKAIIFSSSHVWMWEFNYKDSWATKNWCFWTVVLEKTLESPSDCKEVQPVHPKGDQSWVFIGRTDVEAETPILLILGKIEDGKRRDDRGWNGWMASPTQVTWVWTSSGSQWWTGRPGMLQSMGLQRVRHDWETELKSTLYASWYNAVRSTQIIAIVLV